MRPGGYLEVKELYVVCVCECSCTSHWLLFAGFGALIRAMGKSVEKSQNKDACRDLSGRRVRDVQAEKKLLI